MGIGGTSIGGFRRGVGIHPHPGPLPEGEGIFCPATLRPAWIFGFVGMMGGGCVGVVEVLGGAGCVGWIPAFAGMTVGVGGIWGGWFRVWGFGLVALWEWRVGDGGFGVLGVDVVDGWGDSS